MEASLDEADFVGCRQVGPVCGSVTDSVQTPSF